MTERQTNEALEKLNRGIQESRQRIQEQSMKLAQDYFDDSVEALKQEIKESRDTLEGLPEQIPGGQEEAFQMLFQELMDNYAAIEDAIGESQKNVANLDTEQLRRQGELNASEAARREARELGVDLTEVEGTGSGGNITVKDVRKAAEEAEAAEDAAAEEINASDAARRRAEELGIDLSEVEGTGSGGMITVMDVTEFADETGQATTDTAAQATQQAGQVADGTTEAAGQAADAAGQEVAGRNGSEEELKATSAARRKAEELGVDLSNVRGSGANGLITIKDVVQA
ncbi:MAG: E3 binding domain-containing protein [Actinomycetota bacterium]|nr:E3 binding domain-containing protein [Actinomycetota bacterium]